MKNDKDYTIAIFDSGIGGISILRQLISKYKAGKYIYFADNLYMPYGNKDREFVKSRVNEIIDYLRQEHKVDKIIIACNTFSLGAPSKITGMHIFQAHFPKKPEITVLIKLKNKAAKTFIIFLLRCNYICQTNKNVRN